MSELEEMKMDAIGHVLFIMGDLSNTNTFISDFLKVRQALNNNNSNTDNK